MDLATQNHSQPLVSVICLCFEHEKYVREALQSVLDQSYGNIELIVVDDGSQDGSVTEIERFLNDHPKWEVTFLPLPKNMGNCKAFNKGLAHATGKYVIDLAADDLFQPKRVQKQVATFERLPENYAVVFSDVLLIEGNGTPISTYYQRDKQGKLLQQVPSGNVYLHLLKRAFISPPSMMMRKSVLDAIGGYDEDLYYEDFDFWVRTGKKHLYHFQNETLTLKREIKGSHNSSFYRKNNNLHLNSTLLVFEKAFAQNETTAENKALANNVRYHLRLATFTENFIVAKKMFGFLQKIDTLKMGDWFVFLLIQLKFPLHRLYHWYLYSKNPRA